MGLDILFGMGALDGAGAKLKEARDKKKLEEAESNPEEHERKQKSDKIARYMLIFLFFIVPILISTQ